jgi:hypothetical protein
VLMPLRRRAGQEVIARDAGRAASEILIVAPWTTRPKPDAV